MKYFLGVDFGGGASKATLLSEQGKVVATATKEYPTAHPAPGMSEQNPDDWYAAICFNVRAVLEKAGVAAREVAALSLDAATHTAVLCDEDFRPLRPAIYWTDTRSQKEVADLRAEMGDRIRALSYHSVDTIWTLPQILWVKRQESELFSRTKKILFAKDYVRHRLTGDYVTDVIEAEGSMLFDMEKGCWSEELCAAAGLDSRIMPTLFRPGDIVGSVTAAAAQDTGLLEGTPVLCGTTDTVMEVFAAGGVRPGNMTVKLATAGRICVITEQPFTDRDLVCYSHIEEGLWYPGTATKAAASSYRWFRDAFGTTYRELDELASAAGVGAGGVLFHPYLNGELTPYANPRLSGSFVGVRAGHGKGHFARAVLEGVAYSLRDCLATVDRLGMPRQDHAVIIGGGASSPLWRQIVSDVLGISLIERENSDSSFGSAMLAGVAAGAFSSPVAALEACTAIRSRTTPNAENKEAYDKAYRRYRAVAEALLPLAEEV